MNPIKVAQFGLGPIGLEAIKLAAEKPWIEIVGAVDNDPRKAGAVLGELTGIAAQRDRRIYASFDELWEAAPPAVVLHTAGSKVATTITQIEPMVRRGVAVISSCEELLYPALRAPSEAAALDALCRAHGGRVLGTGVNPGFVMDLLPICLTAVSREVKSVYAERVVNASTRRLPLQKKIGSGLEPDEFRRLFAEGKMGHAGFRESVALIAHALGWTLDDVRETCEPVVAERAIATPHLMVQPGQTCGLHQRIEGRAAGELKVTLDLAMYLDAPDPHDAMEITGQPPLKLRIDGGVAGDMATIAAMVNAIPRVLQAPPGVLLVTDLGVPSWRAH